MRLSALMMLLCVSACANGQGSYCSIAKPIYLDKGDRISNKTASTILTHDETGMELCGWKAGNP